MSWTRHDQLDRVVWLEAGPIARAIAADAGGVHPRLDRRDHLERTCLESSRDVERYLDERDPGDDAGDVLIVASVVVHHLRAERTTAAAAA